MKQRDHVVLRWQRALSGGAFLRGASLAAASSLISSCSTLDSLWPSAALEALAQPQPEHGIDSGYSYRTWDGEQALLLVFRPGAAGERDAVVDILALGDDGAIAAHRTLPFDPKAEDTLLTSPPAHTLRARLQETRQQLFLDKKSTTDEGELERLGVEILLNREQMRLLEQLPQTKLGYEREQVFVVGPARSGPEMAFIEERINSVTMEHFQTQNNGYGGLATSITRFYLSVDRTARLHILGEGGAREIIEIPDVQPETMLGGSHGLSFHSLWSHEGRWLALAFEDSRSEDWQHRPISHRGASTVPVVGDAEVANTIGAVPERAFVVDLSQGTRTALPIETIMQGCESLIAIHSSPAGIDLSCFDRDGRGLPTSLDQAPVPEGHGRVVWRRLDPTGREVVQESAAALDASWLWGYPEDIRYADALDSVVVMGQDEQDQTPCGKESDSYWAAVMSTQGAWLREPACVEQGSRAKLDHAYDGTVILDGQGLRHDHPVVFFEASGNNAYWLSPLPQNCHWWPGGGADARGAWAHPYHNTRFSDKPCPVGWTGLRELR
jgi:hypothetical protein